MNWIEGLLSGRESLQRILFRSAALSGDVQSSYTFDVILSVPVPVPNSLLWMVKAGITNCWLVLLFNIFLLDVLYLHRRGLAINRFCQFFA